MFPLFDLIPDPPTSPPWGPLSLSKYLSNPLPINVSSCVPLCIILLLVVCVLIYLHGFYTINLLYALLFSQQYLFLLSCKVTLPSPISALHPILRAHHTLFIHSPTVEHLGCLQLFATVPMSPWTFGQNINKGVELLRCMIPMYSISPSTASLFFRAMAVSVYFSQTSRRPHIFTTAHQHIFRNYSPSSFCMFFICTSFFIPLSVLPVLCLH